MRALMGRNTMVMALMATMLSVGACGKSGSSAPSSADEPPAATAVADTLTFGVEGMRRINGAL
jgi:hypothetical protein